MRIDALGRLPRRCSRRSSRGPRRTPRPRPGCGPPPAVRPASPPRGPPLHRAARLSTARPASAPRGPPQHRAPALRAQIQLLALEALLAFAAHPRFPAHAYALAAPPPGGGAPRDGQELARLLHSAHVRRAPCRGPLHAPCWPRRPPAAAAEARALCAENRLPGLGRARRGTACARARSRRRPRARGRDRAALARGARRGGGRQPSAPQRAGAPARPRGERLYPSRTNWTRLVPPSVLNGHVSSLRPPASGNARVSIERASLRVRGGHARGRARRGSQASTVKRLSLRAGGGGAAAARSRAGVRGRRGARVACRRGASRGAGWPRRAWAGRRAAHDRGAPALRCCGASPAPRPPPPASACPRVRSSVTSRVRGAAWSSLGFVRRDACCDTWHAVTRDMLRRVACCDAQHAVTRSML
jgi:hypothetical protein